jgi:hypothetical protein
VTESNRRPADRQGVEARTRRQNLSGEHIVRNQTERIKGPRALTAIPCRAVADAERR